MKFPFWVAGVSLIVLSACGGGGGGSSSAPPTSSNQAPRVASANADQAAQVGYDFSYDALQGGTTFADPDGDSLNIAVSFSPGANGLSVSNGVITGTPIDTGDITVTVTASDGSAGIRDVFLISVTADQDAVQAKFPGVLDLDNLFNYAAPTVPDYIRPARNVPNPVTDKGATLGRVIFYDKSLSVNGTVACATCHRQAEAFSETSVVSGGVLGGQTGRSSMRLVNTLYGQEQRFFWDERAVNMEDQVTKPFKDHNEHGFSGENGRPDFDVMLANMQADEAYKELFRFVFLDETVTEERIQSALAQFVHSITSFDSKYDAGRAQVAADADPFPNFTADENAGKNLFLRAPGGNNGGAGCGGCHGAPEFSIAVDRGTNGVVGVAADPNAFDFTNTRAPSLRDVLREGGIANGRFMHDGSLASLRDVVNHYNNIPVPANEPERTEFLNTIDNRLVDVGTPRVLNLSESEKDQIIAFLGTLTGSNIYTDEKWNDPF